MRTTCKVAIGDGGVESHTRTIACVYVFVTKSGTCSCKSQCSGRYIATMVIWKLLFDVDSG